MTAFIASFLAFALAAGALALGVRRGARRVERSCAAGRALDCGGCEGSEPTAREPR